MARIVELEAGFAVAPQLVAADFAEIAAQGFRTVINNRPDGEAEDQLPAAEAAKLAAAHGLEYVHLPFRGYEVSDADMVDEFAMAAAQAKGPVLAYCRTGTRCTLLWSQYAAGRLGAARVTAIARQAGYNVTVVEDEIAERAAATQSAAAA